METQDDDFEDFFAYVMQGTMEETGDTCEDFWNEHGNYAKANFILWLITRVIASPHSHCLAAELRADEPFHDLLREHVSLRGFSPDVRA